MLPAGSEFKTGKTVFGELRGSKQLAFFVCSAGKSISEKSTLLLSGEDPVLGYVYDVLGAAIVEDAGYLMQSNLKQENQITSGMDDLSKSFTESAIKDYYRYSIRRIIETEQRINQYDFYRDYNQNRKSLKPGLTSDLSEKYMLVKQKMSITLTIILPESGKSV